MRRTQQLGRYHLLDRIACGGMAEVYRARTFDVEGRAHLVAIKRVLTHLIQDDDFIQMLVDEAKIAGLLVHNNIAQVYEFVHLGDNYFISMEYVDGKDVRSILDRCRANDEWVPAADAAYVAAEVCDALQAAHTQRDRDGSPLKIVHRDISPSNVICSYQGQVKLCDFGIAKAVLSRVQTKTGVIKGKVKYMSPEQAMGKRLDARSDLFSLGVVLYEMLTRQSPFSAPAEMELIFAVRDARYLPIREINPNVPPELCDVVDRAMTRSRGHRFQTAHDFGLALRGFLSRHAPRYQRSRLAHLLRRLFENDIESDLRLMEDYEVDGAPTEIADMGVNLIADALGPDAPYSQFTPMVRASGTLESRSRPTVQPGFDLHSAETLILTRNRVPPAAAGPPGPPPL
ncbi:MAG: serine/threonine protein kinase, partial [Deltaproteobacteria bacterium]|nr:serine/threonine protein kinase [Deltaproteobacteria bacterium]